MSGGFYFINTEGSGNNSIGRSKDDDDMKKIEQQTISYGELARRIGNPKASRAVGLANGSNPIPIVIPCHRVIGSNGKLTGYGGGLPIKEKLLALEIKFWQTQTPTGQ